MPRMPLRTTGWSSATRTRTTSLIERRTSRARAAARPSGPPAAPSGSAAAIVVPTPGSLSIVSEPPRCSRRSRMPVTPNPPPSLPLAIAIRQQPGLEPDAIVAHVEPDRVIQVAERERHPARSSVLAGVRERLLRDAEHDRLRLGLDGAWIAADASRGVEARLGTEVAHEPVEGTCERALLERSSGEAPRRRAAPRTSSSAPFGQSPRAALARPPTAKQALPAPPRRA